jgi:ABC-type uncharacterized transport system substrate-binding protein
MRRLRAQVVFALTAVAIFVAQLTEAVAHPHVWVMVATTILYDKGSFTGLQQKWTFDEYYTAYAIEGLKNHDGIYDREELSELAKVNVEAIKAFGYFTYPVLGGQEVKVKPAQDYWLELKDKTLSLHFTLLFEQPILIEARGFAYAVEDPTYYIAFLPAKVDPVKFGEGTPNTCNARAGRRKDDSNADVESLAKSFGQLATRVSAANAVSIDCAGP